MILGEESTRTFVLNNRVKVVVKSTMKADKVFTHEITVKAKDVTTQPLNFINKVGVQKLIENLDLEVDQASLLD